MKNENNLEQTPLKLNRGKEFNIDEHVLILWRNRLLILVTLSICVLLGAGYYFAREKSYVSTIVLVPDTRSPNGVSTRGLGGLASVAGINLGGASQSDDLPVALYPAIIASTPFKQRLMESKVTLTASDQKVTFKEYYTQFYNPPLLTTLKKYTIGLPGLIWSSIRKSGEESNLEEVKWSRHDSMELPRLTRTDKTLMSLLESVFEINLDEEQGHISLVFTMPEPEMAAQMAKHSQMLLAEFVQEFKTQKAMAELEFLEDRYREKRLEYDLIQNQLATYRDANQIITTAKAKTKEERLENDFSLQAAVVQELAKNIESQKLEVAKSKPSFIIIQPPFIPLDPKPLSKIVIVFVSLFIGVLIALSIIYGRLELRSAKRYLTSLKE